MKRVIFLTIIVLVTTIYVNAQHQGPPKFDSEKMATITATELSQKICVTSAVQDSLTSTFLIFFKSMDKEIESGKKPNFEKLEYARDTKVKSLITDEQYQKYLKFMEERQPKPNKNDDKNIYFEKHPTVR